MVIELVDARCDAERRWVENVYPLYLHDLSEFDPSLYHLNEEGVWQPDYLPSWFSLPGARPLVLREQSQRVGFALVGQRPFPYRSADVDQLLSEFFILRACRGRGLGRAAALSLFQAFPGVWELLVLNANKPAKAFWQEILKTSGFTYELDTVEGAVRYRFQV